MPQIRSRLVAGKDWAAIARQQQASIFAKDNMAHITAFADAIDQLDDLRLEDGAEVSLRTSIELTTCSAPCTAVCDAGASSQSRRMLASYSAKQAWLSQDRLGGRRIPQPELAA